MSAVNAAPLCRDLKGLFTPCPKGLTRVGSKRLSARAAHEHHVKAQGSAPLADRDALISTNATVTEAKTAQGGPQHYHQRTPAPFAAGVTVSEPIERHGSKLCRDLKGLFTPCPK